MMKITTRQRRRGGWRYFLLLSVVGLFGGGSAHANANSYANGNFCIWLSTPKPSRTIPRNIPEIILQVGRGGGAAKIPTLTKDGTTSNGKSHVEKVSVVKVLQLRRINWLKLLQRVSFLVALIRVHDVYNSIGVPYAQKVWELLHNPTKTTGGGDMGFLLHGMPYFYDPSSQDIRIAQTLAAQSGDLFPPEWLPGIGETIAAIVNVLFYLFLRFFCPLSLQEWFMAKPLSLQERFMAKQQVDSLASNKKASNNDNHSIHSIPADALGIMVQVDQQDIISRSNNKKDTPKIRQSTLIRPLHPVVEPYESMDDNNNNKAKKARQNKASLSLRYYFDIRKNHRFYWDPSNGKVTCP